MGHTDPLHHRQLMACSPSELLAWSDLSLGKSRHDCIPRTIKAIKQEAKITPQIIKKVIVKVSIIFSFFVVGFIA